MIYLDNNATTPIRQEVFEAMVPYLTYEYGNPSSKYYALAVNAKNAVETARENVAKLIGAKSEEIVFTSGSTETTNMIIKGVSDYKKLYEHKGNHIITTKVEHKATLNVCKYLNGDIYSNADATFLLSGESRKVDRGYAVTFLDVNSFGQVDPAMLLSSIKPTTILASILWGNNEIGSLNAIETIGSICHEKGIAFHTDATQVIGKLPVDVSKMKIDYMSMSAHKLGGPKGIGAAYIKGDDYGLPPISSLLHGGEQENGLRGSTLAVHDIVGFGKAAELALKEREMTTKNYQKLDEIFISEIKKISHIQLLGDPVNRLPGVYNILVHDNNFNNERFLKKVSNDFALSAGSACSAGGPSHVLEAIGLGEYTSKVIRLSVKLDALPSDIISFIKLL